MTYNKVHPGGWHNAPDNTTPINADALNTIEDGIAAAAVAADVAAQLGTLVPSQSTAPDHTLTQGWVDTSSSPAVLKTWNGTAWVASSGGTTITDNGNGTGSF